MQFYLAPLEGITTTIFRNAYHEFFRPMDKYFTPFLVPHSKKGFSAKEKREILPENNKGLCLVPQIMSNHAQDCIKTMGKLLDYGYREINLNLGCTTKTVVSKGRGSGFLAFPEELDRFFDEVFKGMEGTGVRISVKTRIGKDEPGEFTHILDIYNRYPLEELIIHPRVQKDFYKNEPNPEMFAYGLENSRCSVCYNGDIFNAERYGRMRERFPEASACMLGRGIRIFSALLGEIHGEGGGAGRLRRFHDRIYEGYQSLGMGDRNVLFKMKELWCYLGDSFPGHEKPLKKIRKAQCADRYEEAVAELI